MHLCELYLRHHYLQLMVSHEQVHSLCYRKGELTILCPLGGSLLPESLSVSIPEPIYNMGN